MTIEKLTERMEYSLLAEGPCREITALVYDSRKSSRDACLSASGAQFMTAMPLRAKQLQKKPQP